MGSREHINEMVEKSRVAQKVFEKFNQEQVDQVVKVIGKVVYDNAELLARMAVDETKMGVYEDKVAKNRGKSEIIWNDLKDKKSVGIIGREVEKGIVLVAKPIGVIGSVTPITNPTVTPMSNAMFALKGRNSIVVAPHPRAKKCSGYTVKLINEALKKYNMPESLIQIIEEPTIELTNELMRAVDAVVATGGAAMVKAAYSSGKPAFGVGPGNVQCIVDRDVDFVEASKKIILGRSFDNGIICSGEQTVIVHEEDYDAVMKALEENGGFLVKNPAMKDALRRVLFVDGVTNKDVVGQSTQKIGKIAGIEIPENTKVILVEADGIGKEDILCREKMCPVLAIFKYKEFNEAVSIAQTNLELEGKGHSCSIHSNNIEHIEYAGEILPISRLVVNQPCSTSAGGSFFNGFAPTTTLGCGTWGNNSISENFTYKHMINVSRIGYYMKDNVAPSAEELWA